MALVDFTVFGAMALLRVCCLLLMVVYLPSIENVAVANPHLRQVIELRRPIGFRRQQLNAADDVSSTTKTSGSFFRGAIESPPQLTIDG